MFVPAISGHFIVFSQSVQSKSEVIYKQLDNRGWIFGRCWEFFSLPPHPDQLYGSHAFLTGGYRGSLRGGKAAGA
jgi:hypothetical protein